jgi:hypothetical protein
MAAVGWNAVEVEPMGKTAIGVRDGKDFDTAPNTYINQLKSII